MIPALEVRNLDRTFGDVHALREVNLEVQPGEVHALLGPNGAGKTTLLRILAGICDPSSGQVFIQGVAVDELGYRDRRKTFSMVPSGERTSYQRLSGYESLLCFGRLSGLWGASAR